MRNHPRRQCRRPSASNAPPSRRQCCPRALCLSRPSSAPRESLLQRLPFPQAASPLLSSGCVRAWSRLRDCSTIDRQQPSLTAIDRRRRRKPLPIDAPFPRRSVPPQSLAEENSPPHAPPASYGTCPAAMRVPRVYGPHLPARTRTHTVGRKRSQQCHGPTVMAGAARHCRERTAPPPRPLRAPRPAPMAPLLIVRLAGEAKRGGEGGKGARPVAPAAPLPTPVSPAQSVRFFLPTRPISTPFVYLLSLDLQTV